MSIYDLILIWLFRNGPIVSLFRFCCTNEINYSWAWQQMERARERKHITVTRCSQRGKPNSIELTRRGLLYVRSNIPGGAA